MTSQPRAPVPFLICRCGSRLCALLLEHVVESMRPLPVSPIAAVPSFVLGVAIIRDRATPVVHVARLIGETQSTPVTRFVTMRVGAGVAAFAVDAVVGVRALEQALLEEIPVLLRQVQSSGIAAVALLDTELLVVLQDARVIPDDAWEALASQEPPA